MDRQHKNLEITGQGFGLPEPVDAGSERAGSPRPSADDCSVGLVNDQANPLGTITGRYKNETNSNPKEITEVFTRKDRIGRSPIRPRQGSIGATADLWTKLDPNKKSTEIGSEGAIKTNPEMEEADSENQNNDNRESKRKRVESPIQNAKENGQYDRFLERIDREYNMLRDIVKKTTDEVNTLKTLITEIPNTKKEIKKAISKLDGYSKRMPTTMSFIQEIVKELTTNTKTAKKTDSMLLKDSSTQTVNKKQETKENLIANIENELDQEPDGQQLHELLDLQWPEEIFKKCQLRENETMIWEAEDLIVLTTTKEGLDDKNLEKVKKRDPYIETIIKEKQLNLGKLTCSVTTNGIIDENDVIKNKTEKYTYLISTSEDDDRHRLCEGLNKAFEIAKKNKKEKISCTTTDHINHRSVRQMLEYIGRKENIQIDMYKKTRRKSTISGKEESNDREKFKSTKRKNEDTIILQPLSGTTFADIVKSMKEDVSTDGIIVDRVTKTNRGNVEIKIKGKEEKSRLEFKNQLNTKLGQIAKMSTRTRNQTLMILDIDETIQEREVKEIIKKELNNISHPHDEIIIKLANKPNSRGLKYAFATGAENMIKELAIKKRIGQGWHRWRVREVNSVPRCYKCHWVGHKANECKMQDGEVKCHKCGETGHKKIECQKSQKCYLCQEEGHNAETLKCPKYKQLIQAQNKEKRIASHTSQ